jgi:uncharacterized protein YndB with AHSA1/START domain
MDRIERVVVLPVARNRVWAAISEPDQISRWFGSAVEVEFRAGAIGAFIWEKERARIRIVAIEPPRRFAYQWYPGSGEDLSLPFDEQPLTLVEFQLDEMPDGTRLTLIESGFAALSPDHYRRSWRENNEGWDEELADLVAHLSPELNA